MRNKTKILKLLSQLPEPLQQNKLINRMIASSLDRQKARLTHELIKSRWQIVQLESVLATTKKDEDMTNERNEKD